MAVSQIKSNKSLSNIMSYVKGSKGSRVVLESGVFIHDIKQAEAMMKDVKKQFNKRQGLVECYSTKVSFSDKELNPHDPIDQQTALDVCHDIAQQAFPDNQSYIAIHNDSKGGKLHGHILTNSTKFTTGKQLAGNEKSWKHTLAPAVDNVCKSYGLKTIEKTDLGYHPYKENKPTHLQDIEKSRVEPYMQARAKADGEDLKDISWKEYLRDAVYTTMTDRSVTSLDQFKDDLLNNYDVSVAQGKRDFEYSVLWETRGQKKNHSLTARKLANNLTDEQQNTLKTTGVNKLGKLFGKDNVMKTIEMNQELSEDIDLPLGTGSNRKDDNNGESEGKRNTETSSTRKRIERAAIDTENILVSNRARADIEAEEERQHREKAKRAREEARQQARQARERARKAKQRNAEQSINHDNTDRTPSRSTHPAPKRDAEEELDL